MLFLLDVSTKWRLCLCVFLCGATVFDCLVKKKNCATKYTSHIKDCGDGKDCPTIMCCKKTLIDTLRR